MPAAPNTDHQSRLRGESRKCRHSLSKSGKLTACLHKSLLIIQSTYSQSVHLKLPRSTDINFPGTRSSLKEHFFSKRLLDLQSQYLTRYIGSAAASQICTVVFFRHGNVTGSTSVCLTNRKIIRLCSAAALDICNTHISTSEKYCLIKYVLIVQRVWNSCKTPTNWEVRSCLILRCQFLENQAGFFFGC